MEPIKIPIEHFDCDLQKNTEVVESYLELGDNYITYVFEGYLQNKNEDTDIFEEKDLRQVEKVLKKNVIGYELDYKQKVPCWLILLNVWGRSSDIWVRFKKERDAREVADKIDNWLFNS